MGSHVAPIRPPRDAYWPQKCRSRLICTAISRISLAYGVRFPNNVTCLSSFSFQPRTRKRVAGNRLEYVCGPMHDMIYAADNSTPLHLAAAVQNNLPCVQLVCARLKKHHFEVCINVRVRVHGTKVVNQVWDKVEFDWLHVFGYTTTHGA